MNGKTARVFYWIPRVLCILFAAFLCIFALDVFGMPIGFGQKLLAFLIHLVPTWLVLLTLWVVWRKEWVAAILFPLLALLHLGTKWGQLDWSGYVIIEAPLLLLAVLFWISWRNRTTLRASTR